VVQLLLLSVGAIDENGKWEKKEKEKKNDIVEDTPMFL
jgi:hypothetical protein